MAVPYVDYAGESEGRGPSLKVWNPYLPAMGKIDAGMFGNGSCFLKTDFMFDHDLTNMFTFTDTTPVGSAATFTLADAVHGEAVLDSVSTTAAEGGQIQAMGATGERILPAAGRIIVLEGRLKVVDNATGPEFFFGLHTVDTTIIASSALSDGTGQSYAGFASVTDDNILVSYTADNTSRTVGTTTLDTLVASTWVKLALVIDGTDSVKFYVNGSLKETVTTTVPAEEMAFSAVCQTPGTVSPATHFDWLLGYQIDALD